MNPEHSTVILAVLVVAIALFFDFTNGFHDSANIVATSIVSHALEPITALIIAAVAEFIGAYFLGTAVAETIGFGIVNPSRLAVGSSGAVVIISALFGAISWNLITWYFGIPSSSSHALVGGLVGAFFFGFGVNSINWLKVWHVVVVMIFSPFVGLLVTYFFTRLTLVFSQWFTPSVNRVFQHLQIVSSVMQALAHGTNDAQKTMGVITFSLVVLGLHTVRQGQPMLIPRWVIIACALTISIGMATGGFRIIKTLGLKLYKIRPIHGFASQTASALIIYITAFFGYPISTTQVISSSVMGAGAAFRPKMIRWSVVQDMLFAWLITMPISGLIAGLCFFVLTRVV